jgi:Flp pilus assembly protein TadG
VIARARASTSGQALTEVLIVMPLLLLLIMGAIDVGRMLFASVALEEAAQEGALFAAYNPTDENPIRARVLSSSTAEEVTGATVTVDCVPTPAPGTIEVTVETDYPLITPIMAGLLGSPVTLSATVIATNVQGTCT